MVMFNIFGRRLYIHYVGKQEEPEPKKNDMTAVEKKKFEIFLKEGYFNKSVFYGWNRPNDTNKRWKEFSLLEWVVKSMSLAALFALVGWMFALFLAFIGVSGMIEFALVASFIAFIAWVFSLLVGMITGLFLDMWFHINIL